MATALFRSFENLEPYFTVWARRPEAPRRRRLFLAIFTVKSTQNSALNRRERPRVGDGRPGPTGTYVREGEPDRGVQGGGAPRLGPRAAEIFGKLRASEAIF